MRPFLWLPFLAITFRAIVCAMSKKTAPSDFGSWPVGRENTAREPQACDPRRRHDSQNNTTDTDSETQ